MNTEDKLREALEQIANFSDVEMGDGDGARKVALEALTALAAPAAPSEPVVNFAPLHVFAEANRVSYNELCAAVRAAITPQPSAKPAGAGDSFVFGSQFLSDVLTAAGLVSSGKRCKNLGERLGNAVMAIRSRTTPPAAHAGLSDAERVSELEAAMRTILLNVGDSNVTIHVAKSALA